MPDTRQAALQFAHQNQDLFLEQLKEVVRIPSISTNPENNPDIQATAEWVASRLRSLGVENVQVLPTAGHPAVVGEWLKAPGKPTVLIYGHYDVQPVDPIDLWESDPFEPLQRGDNLYGRGTSDMKGQLVATLAAIHSIMAQGDFPVNLRFLIEGEEEVGSPNLPAFIATHTHLLKSDLCLNPDTGMLGADLPTITYGLRGLAYFELRVYGPDHDLHSGMFGGVVHNPAQVVCELVAGMHDAEGRVTLPGFYDRVRPLEADERLAMSRLPVQDEFYVQQTGASQLWGEQGYTANERVSARPTLDVNGLFSGFTGKGSKTVLPAWGMAKVSMRLVPDQDPDEVHRQLIQYMEEHAPATVRWEVESMAGGPAFITDRNSVAVKALAKGLEAVWGKEPLYKREGGSVPVLAEIQKHLHIDWALTGFGLPDDRIHSPNEKLHLPTWSRGIDTLIHFFYNLVEA